MRPLLALLLAGSVLAPTPASAQQVDLAAVQEQLAAMQAEIARLTAQVAELQAREEQRETAPVPAPATASAAAPPPSPAIAWKGAPEIAGEGGWSFKPRGRLQIDAGVVNAPDSTGRADGFGSELRRARIGVEGTMPGGIGYKFEIDVAGNEVEVADAILTYSDGGFQLSAGQHNPFQSLEELTSSRFSSFIERAAFTDAFAFERRLGLSGQYSAGAILLQGGVFSDNIDALPGQSWSADGRAVYLPKLGDTQVHLGGSVHFADTDSSSVRYRQRPLVHFTAERFVDTGSFASESEFGVGAEAAVIHGRFHAAGEAFWQSVDRPGALADPTFFGGYAEVGVFLTPGDTRGYKGGTFDRVKPASSLDDGGFGALQLNLRYDHLDLVDGGIAGGTQNGYFASLIWTPTDFTRLMLNYGRLRYGRAVHPTGTGDRSYGVDVVGMRAQVDF
jgi:phosphate-selective porin OprO/OprP